MPPAAPRQRHVPLDRAPREEEFADVGIHRFARFQLDPQQVADAPLYFVAHGPASLTIHGLHFPLSSATGTPPRFGRSRTPGTVNFYSWKPRRGEGDGPTRTGAAKDGEY